jgi:hypothetical protein
MRCNTDHENIRWQASTVSCTYMVLTQETDCSVWSLWAMHVAMYLWQPTCTACFRSRVESCPWPRARPTWTRLKICDTAVLQRVEFYLPLHWLCSTTLQTVVRRLGAGHPTGPSCKPCSKHAVANFDARKAHIVRSIGYTAGWSQQTMGAGILNWTANPNATCLKQATMRSPSIIGPRGARLTVQARQLASHLHQHEAARNPLSKGARCAPRALGSEMCADAAPAAR